MQSTSDTAVIERGQQASQNDARDELNTYLREFINGGPDHSRRCLLFQTFLLWHDNVME